MPPEEPRTASVRVKRDRKSLTVDIHCHVLTPEVERLACSSPEKQAEGAAQLRMHGAE